MIESLNPCIYILDDDWDACKAMAWVLGQGGFEAIPFLTGDAFFGAYDPARPSCLFLDVHLKNEYGPDLQKQLLKTAPTLTVVTVTAYGNVSLAMQSVKYCGSGFLEKPFNNDELLETATRAIAESEQRVRASLLFKAADERLVRLSKKEHVVFELVAQGHSSNAIAEELSLSRKTVECHRASIKSKTRTKDLAELVALSQDHKGWSPPQISPVLNSD